MTMPGQDVSVDLDLGGNYTLGVQQATDATSGLATALSTVQAPARGVQNALNAATPTKAHLAAWGGFTAAAAYFQSQTSGIRATASAAGQSVRVLDGDVQRLARTFPIGTSGAVAMVQAVQGLGASEKQIGPLAVVMERLAGATSSMGPELAMSFGQLNRQLASLDPNRVQRFGDVLTTVAAKSGASAAGIVNFAQAIAPVAQQAGIGESAVLGISSSFVKLGEDGGAAATAVNKILGDLNRSVREGSNDMTAYAQITGVTVQRFKQLYQANPAQTLASVTAAIGRAGPQGQMLLESLGLEGVRTQRSLLELSQSGGLGAAVNQAVGAYGNNSTAAAAKQAFGGLTDSLTELRSTAGQTADALGGPFLGVLTRITGLAKTALAPVNAVLGSGAGQHTIAAIGGLAVTGLLARRLVRPLGTLAIAGQAATSGPARSLAGGYALGRTEDDLLMAGRMRTGRFGREPVQSAALGIPYGRGPMLPINMGALRAGRTLGSFVSDLRGPIVAGGQPGGFVSGLGQAARTGFTAGSMGWEAWMRSFRDPFHQAFSPAGQRYSMLLPTRQFDPTTGRVLTGQFGRQGAMASAVDVHGMTYEAERNLGTGRINAQLKALGAGFSMLDKESGSTSRAFGRLTTSTAAAARDVATFGARTAFAGARTGLSAAGSIVGGIGSSALGLVGGAAGAAMLGGGLLYSAYRASQSRTNTEQDRVMSLDMFSELNHYRDAIGQAGAASQSLADQFQQAAATIAKSVTTMPRATRVTAQDVAALGPNPTPHKGALTYRGSNADIAGQISGLNVTNLQPTDLQAVKMDLLRQGMDPGRVESILKMVHTNQGGQVARSTTGGLVGGVAAGARSYSESDLQAARRVVLPGEKGLWQKIGGGGGVGTPQVGDDGKRTLDVLQGAVMQQYASLSDNYSHAFVVQKQIRTVNTALQQALRTNNPDTVAAVAQRLGIAVTGDKKFHVTAQAVRDSGGDITQLVGDRKIYGQSADFWRRQGVSPTGPGLRPQLIASGTYANIAASGANALLPFFDSARQHGAMGAAQGAVGAYGLAPASASAQLKAVSSMVDASTKAGTSLTDLAVQAGKASSVTADWQQQLLQAVAAEAQFRESIRLQGAGRGATLAASIGSDLRTMQAGPGTDPNGFQAQQYAKAKQDLASQRQSVIEYYQSRIMAQYQYQIQSERAQEDYQRQSSRSEEDFMRGRRRAVRDFNIQITREIQDAAGSMYDPYTRIATQPVWDSANLIGNEQQQVTAMRQQVENIRKLKELGLDDAAIQQLKLYDPNNAQQAQELVNDLTANRGQISQLNQIAGTRQRLAGQLISQDPQFKRQREDFNRNLRDQQRDYNIARSRMVSDFHLSQSRMAQDMQTQDLQLTNNMEQLSKDMSDVIHGRFVDLHKQVVNSLISTQDAVGRFWPHINNMLLHPGSGGGGSGGTADTGITATGSQRGGGYGNVAVGSGSGANLDTPGMHHTAGSTGSVGTNYVKPGTGSVYGPTGSMAAASAGRLDSSAELGTDSLGGANFSPPESFKRKHPADPNFNKSIAKRMAPGWRSGLQWKAWEDLWTAESGWSQYSDNQGAMAYGIPQASPGNKMRTAGSDWRTNPATQIAWGINYIAGKYHSPLDVARKMGLWKPGTTTLDPSYKGYAAGGIATAPHLGMVAEGGSPEAMIPLNAKGMNFLLSALKTYVNPADAKLIGSGGLSTAMHVTYTNDSYHYDRRLDMRGSTVEVKANSPKEMQDAIERKTRSDNMTATRGVTWQT